MKTCPANKLEAAQKTGIKQKQSNRKTTEQFVMWGLRIFCAFDY